MSVLRKIKATVLGQNTDMEKTHALLKEADVPVASCDACVDPCKQAVDEEWPWPKKFDVDFETQMLGSVKPYRRQVVISTGKADWDREVTEVTGTLAAYLSEVQSDAPAFHPSPNRKGKAVEGMFVTDNASRLSILNGSHHPVGSNHDGTQTTLVFPDYTMIAGIPETVEGATSLWNTALDPNNGRGGKPVATDARFRSWVLPYSCVILLCSHKKRDNRCHIASKVLEEEFSRALSEHGYEVHTQLEEPDHYIQTPIEDFTGTKEERDVEITRRLKLAYEGDLDGHGNKRVLILKNSHIGGHKFAGNAILYTPQGGSIWYGRVSPKEVEIIVRTTILGGEVLVPLLRGAGNIQKAGCKNLYEW